MKNSFGHYLVYQLASAIAGIFLGWDWLWVLIPTITVVALSLVLFLIGMGSRLWKS